MDRRFFLALLLTMGVIVVTPRMFPGKPRAVIATTPADSAAAAGTIPGGPASATSAPGATTPGAVSATAATQAPIPAAAAAVEARTIQLTNELATYSFSTRGATLVSADLPRYRALSRDEGTVRLADRLQPLLRYRLLAGGDTIALESLDFTATEDVIDGRSRVTFTAPVGGGSARIAYTLAAQDYAADVAIDVTGLVAPAFLLTDLPSGFDTQERDSLDDRRHLAYAMNSAVEGAERVDFSDPDPGERIVRQGPFGWTAAKSKYFLVGLLATDTTDSPFRELWVTGEIRVNKIAQRARATVITPLGAEPVRFEVYAGPQDWERLVAQGRSFENVNPFGGWISGLVQPFATIVMRLLLWMKRTTALEYGWILVIFGVAIRIAMWPLNSRMMRSQMVMQRIMPQVQAMQEKYKGDPERQREAVMKVYSDAGVSPLAPILGCLPMLIPMPVLFALFFVFQNTIEFRGVPFLWFPDISVADPLYIAPVLTGASMYLLSWLGMRNVPPNPQTKMMAWMMPLVMTIFGVNFAAGLNLYWFVQNFAAMPQQWLISNERGKAAAANTATVVADGGERKRR